MRRIKGAANEPGGDPRAFSPGAGASQDTTHAGALCTEQVITGESGCAPKSCDPAAQLSTTGAHCAVFEHGACRQQSRAWWCVRVPA